MGGSSPGDGGAAQRKAAEEARIKKAITGVNDVFGFETPGSTNVGVNIKQLQAQSAAKAREKAGQLQSIRQGREGLYSQMAQDAVNASMVDLDREREDIARENDFALARQGLYGGSRDVDSDRRIQDRYNQGVLLAANAGDTVANTARSGDERTRVNLINSIRAGLDRGDAIQQAYQGLSNNANEARNAANASNMAGFFGALSPAAKDYAYNQGYNNTMDNLGQQPQTPGQAVGKSSTRGGFGGTTRTIG